MNDTGPRTLNSNVSVVVVFKNCTNESVTLYWYNGTGQKISYDDISPNVTKGMSTFETHPWTAIGNETGTQTLINGEEVFYPEAGPDGKQVTAHGGNTVEITKKAITGRLGMAAMKAAGF